MALSVAECQKMVAAAKEAGTVLAVGQNTRRMARYRKAAELIQDGSRSCTPMLGRNRTSRRSVLFWPLFDSLSFFVTIWIARRALRTISTRSYLCHLGIDLVIAVVATGWILMVFSVSGWLVSYIQFSPESLAERTSEYGGRLEAALRNPLRHWRNVYFGILIGISAMLPTLTHIGLSMYSVTRFLRQRAQPLQETAI